MTEEELRQMNLERLRNYSGAMYSAIIERYRVLPLISTLSAALVSLTIQSTELIKIQSLAFIAFVILLLLIPLSVFATLYQSGRDIESLADRIKNILQPTGNQTGNTNFIGTFTWFLFFLFSVAIILMILSFFDLK